jgi:CRISPR system Cascade subunit CasE
MSWLLRIEMDTEEVSRLKIRDSYDWHQKLWECFPDVPEEKRSFLTRIDFLEGSVRVWLLSERKPVRPAWCPDNFFSLREIAPSFLSHQYYAFDLRANPTKAIVQRNSDGSPKFKLNSDGAYKLGEDGKPKRVSGKRIPIVQKEELHSWIDRKGSAAGFRIVEGSRFEIGPAIEYHFQKRDITGYHSGVQFRGILEVTNSVQFAQAYAKGIGSAKAFGFGLLLLAPVQL